MQIDRLERIFLFLTVTLLAGVLMAIVLSVVHDGVELPTQAGRIDVAEVRNTAPFDAPGVYETAPGKYQAVVIAKAFAFEPAEITIPVGAELTFVVTSIDVIHGFQVWDTNVNAMVIPGQITEVSKTFDEAGEYNIVCHEYCGIGHHGMFGKVVVSG